MAAPRKITAGTLNRIGRGPASRSPDHSQAELHSAHWTDNTESRTRSRELCNPPRCGIIHRVVRHPHIGPVEYVVILPAELELRRLGIQRGLESKFLPKRPIGRCHTRPAHTAAACIAPATTRKGRTECGGVEPVVARLTTGNVVQAHACH